MKETFLLSTVAHRMLPTSTHAPRELTNQELLPSVVNNPSGSSYGIMYGLPKIHKDNIPLRPILSSINTPNYKLAKYLVPLLEPLTNNAYTLRNSLGFKNEILKQDSDLYMLLNLAVRDTVFVFNGTSFKQVEGMAMGGPLGPTFANIFMNSLEESFLDSCPSNLCPLFYRRYETKVPVISDIPDSSTDPQYVSVFPQAFDLFREQTQSNIRYAVDD
ncbi:uncharacterized protein [Macrobrachium rosenbergii]|uniref:uncharacterized protein n=1 Tax=Macrobrachium rosenbergii TaxID=79674 RepID=UPI0034D5B518